MIMKATTPSVYTGVLMGTHTCPYCDSIFTDPLRGYSSDKAQAVSIARELTRQWYEKREPKLIKKTLKELNAENQEKLGGIRKQLNKSQTKVDRDQAGLENYKTKLSAQVDKTLTRGNTRLDKRADRLGKGEDKLELNKDNFAEESRISNKNFDALVNRKGNQLANELVKKKLLKVKQGINSNTKGNVVHNLGKMLLSKYYHLGDIIPCVTPLDYLGLGGYHNKKIEHLDIIELKTTDDFKTNPKLSAPQRQVRNLINEGSVGFKVFVVDPCSLRSKLIESNG